MKKLSKIAAVLAASALLFGTMSCSDGSDDNGGSSSGTTGGSATGGSGSAAAWSSSWDFSSLMGTAADISYGSAQVTGNTIAGVEALTDKLTAFPTHSASGDKLSYFYCLSDVTYPATSGDLSMTILSKDTDSTYSFHNAFFGIYDATTITQTHSKGCLEICGDALSVADVQGPFKVTIVSTANGSSDKTDRGAYVKVGTDLAAAKASTAVKSSSTAAAAGDKMVYSYAGSDKKTVVIGCAGGKSIRVFDVTIEADTATFSASTNNTTTNDIATLGLIGTGDITSSVDTVATAAITEGKIVITSKSAGSTVLTVTDKNSKTATIAVEVASSGVITVGAIKKYEVAAPVVAGGEEKATVTGSIDGLVYSTSKTAADADGAVVAAAEVTGLAAGTYYFWYKATDDYAASAKTEVKVDAAGALTLVYFSSKDFDTTKTVSYAAESSDVTALTGNDLTWTWTSPFAAYSGADKSAVSYYSFANTAFTDGVTDTHSTNVHYDGVYFLPDAITANLAVNDVCATASFTISAVKAITLSNISAKFGQSQTGNIGCSVKVGDTEVLALSGNKKMSFDIDLSSKNISIAAGETKTVTITVAAAKAWSASAKTLSIILGDLTVKAVAAE